MQIDVHGLDIIYTKKLMLLLFKLNVISKQQHNYVLNYFTDTSYEVSASYLMYLHDERM